MVREELKTLHQRPWGTVFGDQMITRRFTNAGGWESSQLVPYSKIPLDPMTSVLHYGSSVFEGLKAFRVLDGGDTSSSSSDSDSSVVLFRPELNAERLNRSAERQALPPVPVKDFLADVKRCASALEQWVPEERGSSLYIRVVLFASQAALGVRRSNEALLLVMGLPVPAYYTSPIRLLAETKFVRSWPGGAGFAKTAGNYALTVMPQESVAKRGMTLLWLDGSPKQNITECGVMNLFILFRPKKGSTKNRLVTPSAETGLILPGITRRSIIELVRAEFREEIVVEERDISIDELIDGILSDIVIDAFGSGTAALVTPIESVTKQGVEDDREHVIASGVDSEQRFFYTLKQRVLSIQHSLHHWNTVVPGYNTLVSAAVNSSQKGTH